MNAFAMNQHRTHTAVLVRSDRLVSTLGLCALFLAALYVVLMFTTIFYAALETKLTRGISDTRVAIEQLENRYYARITELDSTEPSSIGLVAPRRVEYVVAADAPQVTIAR